LGIQVLMSLYSRVYTDVKNVFASDFSERERLDLFEQVALLTEAAAVLVHHLHVFMSHESCNKVCTRIMSLMYMRVYNVRACT
jgi:hypothetical protein